MTLNRRKFLQRMYQVVIGACAAPLLSFDELLAADANPAGAGWSRPDLVWLQGASCSGCSTSFLNIEQITILDFLTYFTRLLYHPNLSSATGDQVPQILNKLAASGKPYILVMEGAIPAGMPHACMMAGRPIGEWVRLLAAKASRCIAAGTCAVSGGVAKMTGTLTGAVSLDEFLKQRSIKTPSVNLPACPMHPGHLVYTLLHFIKSKGLPELDDARRPRRFFTHSVHERCPRYAAFQARDFALRIGEEGCLMELGCQGPVTYNDCVAIGYNGNTNNCVRAGHPCIGCAGELFPRPLLYHTHVDPGIAAGIMLKRT
ncbi:MAG: hydrogenase small subunit [Deltaproteobacteria bacterium]|nr:hydrogenase small subunit [Deltaproteobacteria bacterium]